MKRLVSMFMITFIFWVSAGAAMGGSNLTVYTSMKTSLMVSLRDAFVKQHPNVEFNYYSAGAGNLMAKIASERESGPIVADVLWHSEVPDFYNLKKENMLQSYVSPEAKHVGNPLKDGHGYFTPARNGILGIVYNTKAIKTAPRNWGDLHKPEFKDTFVIANPELSGTAYGSVAALSEKFGWGYFMKCRSNGASIGEGSGQVIESTAKGNMRACIGVDYIAIDKIERGAPLAIVFPKEIIMLPSPIAIIKGTKNLAAAQKFVDFILSKKGQQIIANSGTLPVRADVKLPANTRLPAPHEAVARAIKLDFTKMGEDKENLIKKFRSIM